MAAREEFQGFVPVSILLAAQRVEGKIWKFANRRVLQQIEEDRRQFLPVVEAKLYRLDHGESVLSGEFDVLALNRAAIIAIEPKDTVSTTEKRRGEV